MGTMSKRKKEDQVGDEKHLILVLSFKSARTKRLHFLNQRMVEDIGCWDDSESDARESQSSKITSRVVVQLFPWGQSEDGRETFPCIASPLVKTLGLVQTFITKVSYEVGITNRR